MVKRKSWIVSGLLAAGLAVSVAAQADGFGEGGLSGIIEAAAAAVDYFSDSGVASGDISFSGDQIKFVVDNSPAAPSVEYEPGSGTYAANDGDIRHTINGTVVYATIGNVTRGFTGAGDWGLKNVSPASSPNMGPRLGDADADTGFGAENNGDIDIYSDNSIKMRISNPGVSTPSAATTLGSSVTTFAMTSSLMVVTGDGGGNTIATITAAENGSILRLLFVDGLVTITDTAGHTANTIDLSASFTSADDTMLTLISDGTSWYETSRSVN